MPFIAPNLEVSDGSCHAQISAMAQRLVSDRLLPVPTAPGWLFNDCSCQFLSDRPRLLADRRTFLESRRNFVGLVLGSLRNIA